MQDSPEDKTYVERALQGEAMGQNQSTGGGGGKKEVSSTRLSDPRQTSSDVARAPEEREREGWGRVGLNHDLWLVIYANDDRLTASVPLFPFFFSSSVLALCFGCSGEEEEVGAPRRSDACR